MKFEWVRIFDSGGGAQSTWAANVPGGAVIETVYVNEDDEATAAALVFVPGLHVSEDGDLVPEDGMKGLR